MFPVVRWKSPWHLAIVGSVFPHGSGFQWMTHELFTISKGPWNTDGQMKCAEKQHDEVSVFHCLNHLRICAHVSVMMPVAKPTGTCQDASCERRPIAWLLSLSSLCMCNWVWQLGCIERCIPCFSWWEKQTKLMLFGVMSSTSTGWLQYFMMRRFTPEMNYNETWAYLGFGLQSVTTPVGLIDARPCAATPTPSDLGWECVFGLRQKDPCFCLQFLGKCSDNTQSWECRWWNNKGITERLEKKSWVLLGFL